MIGKLTRTIVRTFAFALTLCATTSAWAGTGPLAYTEASGYSKWSYSRIINWRVGNPSSNSKQDLATATVTELAANGDAEMDADGNTSAGYTMGWNDTSKSSSKRFNSGSTPYASGGTADGPGYVLRFSGAGGTDYRAYADATFYPLTFGGLIVESGATGYSLKSENAGNDRHIEFGSKDGTETWFVINEPFTIVRTTGSYSATAYFYGTVNLMLPDATDIFTLNVQNNIYMSTPTGTSVYPELKFHGAGQLKVNKPLQATGNATLNFANVTRDVDEDGSFDDVDAFIDGDLTIDSSTKFVFPSTLAANTAYPLCTGTLSGAPEAGITSVKIGNTTKNVRLTFSGNKVSYEPVYTATVNGAEISWDEEPESLDNVVLHFTGSGEATGLSGSGTIIYADSGLTVDVTSFTSPTLNGSGIFRYTSGYPTTVPSNYTYEYVGGDTESAEVEITDALKVSGTLRIKGYVYLNSTGTDFYSGSTVEIVSGQTKADTYCSGYSGGFAGTLTIDPDATFVVVRTDTLNRSSTSVVINVYGKLKFDSKRWTVRDVTYHKINLYPGSQVIGSGDGNGVLDFEGDNTKLNVCNVNRSGEVVEGGVAKIIPPIRLRTSGCTTYFNIDSGVTLELQAELKGAGTIGKQGSGKLLFNNIPFNRPVVGSEGTVEFKSSTDHRYATSVGSTFSGKFLVSQSGSVWPHFQGTPPFFNESAPPDMDVTGGLVLTDSYNNNYLAVKNFSGSGSINTNYGDPAKDADNNYIDTSRTIKSLQADDTEYSGTFTYSDARSRKRNASLTVYGATGVTKSLELKGASTTYGDLTIDAYGKIIFSGNGSWNNGTAIVKANGVLESRRNDKVVGALTLESGSKLDFGSGSYAIRADSVSLPADGAVDVDLSAFGIADDASATIISATTLTGVENIGNLQATSGNYTFALDPENANAIKATNIGTCVWDVDSWSKADPSLYSDVTVNVAAGGTTLTLDDDYSFDTITLSGSSGTLTIEANGHTLTVGDIVVPNGVTLVASSAFSVTGSISGGGNLTVPNGKTFTADCVISCSGNMTINGTLNLNTSPTCIVAGGNGTINLGSLSVANGISGFAANAAWSGSVVVPAFTSSGTTIIECNNLGSQNSKIVFKGITRNSWDYIYVNPAGYTIKPTIQLDGNVELTSGVAPPYVTSFAKVTGEGNFALGRVWVGAKINYKINTLENYTGTLSAQRCEDSGTLAEMSLSLGTLALAGGSSPSTSDRLVKISSVSTLSNIVDVDAISVTIGGEATEYKLVKKNVGTATAGLYLAPAVIKNGSTLTPYDSVSAAISAIGPYTTYDYVIVNESATISQNTMSLKLKKGFENVVLTVNTAYPEYTPVPAESSGVITYTLTPTKTTYTWASTLASGVWNTINPFPWRYGASVEANRAPSTCDDIQFARDATITVNEDISVYSIANSANVVFSTTATPTVAANAEGGIVLTAAGASFTVPVGMTLSPTPTTSVADYVVATTGGEESPTVYTAVLGAARVGGTAYATLQAAIDAAGENAVTLLQDNSESITIAAGRTLNVEKGGFTCNVPTSTGCIVVQSDYNDGTGITTYTAPVAAIISTSSTSYYMSISQAELMTFLTLLGDDETTTLTIDESAALDQATRTSLAIQYDIYFDGTTTYSKAVAKRTYPTVATFNSLASAISDSTDGALITLVRDSDEAITLNKSITLTESATFSGAFTGSGTLSLTALLKSADPARWAEGWRGTVVLPTGTLTSPLNFNLYGISGSSVQITGDISGYLPDAEIVTTLKIPDSASLTLTAFSPSRANTFAKIEGEGTLSVPVEATDANDLGNVANWGAGYNYSAYLLIKDVSGFTGSLTANKAVGIAIGTKPHKNTVGGKIILNSDKGATVGSSSAWTATNLKVEGTLSVESGGALSGSIEGEGQIVYLTSLPASTPTIGSSWTGTVVLPSFTAAGHNFNTYGRLGSKVKLSGVNGGWLEVDNLTFNPEIVLAGNFSITDMSQRSYTFNKISGSGDITFTPPQQHEYSGLTISVLASDYVGTIDNNMRNTKLTITRLDLATDPTVAKETKILSSTTAGKITVQDVYYNGTQVDLSRSLSIVNKADGVYIVRAGTIFSVY